MGIADLRTEYESAGIDVDGVDPDPIVQWQRWYDEAVAAGIHEPNAFQLATVDADGHPDSRYLIVRAADERGFGFYTNTTSAKGRQLAARPWAAATFGWLELARQVRIRGPVERMAEDEADAYFASRPRGSRLGAWASPQSTVIAGRHVLDEAMAELEDRFGGDEVVPRPAFWGGYRLVPLTVELWQGRARRLHDRLRYRRAEPGAAWVVERLAP